MKLCNTSYCIRGTYIRRWCNLWKGHTGPHAKWARGKLTDWGPEEPFQDAPRNSQEPVGDTSG